MSSPLRTVRAAAPEDFDLFRSLRGRHSPAGTFIGEGERVVRRMLERTRVLRALCTDRWASLFPPGIDVAVAEGPAIDAITGVRFHQQVMALGAIPDSGPMRGTLLVVLDGIVGAENVGAIIRTAAALGSDGVVVGPDAASPWLRRAVRVSMGAVLDLPIFIVPDLAAALRGRDAWAAHIHGPRRTYTEIDFRSPCAIVFGGEGTGVSDEVLAACRGTIYVPMAREDICLNVAASAAAILSEVARQRR